MAPIVGLMLFALAVHLPVWFGSLYGEFDTAWFVVDALRSARVGPHLEAIWPYRYYTSPGYIWLVTQLLQQPRDPTVVPAGLALNAINFVTSVLIMVPVYLLFRRLAGARAALLGSFLLVVMPSFWQGGLYGFPSLPALAFLVTGLWLFDRWLSEAAQPDRPHVASPTLFACVTCLTVTALLKADIYLSAIALWGLLLYRRRLSWRTAAVLTAAGIVPVVVTYAVSRGLMHHSPESVEFAGRWNSQWPIEIRRQLASWHVLQVAKSMGALTLPAFAAALTVLLGRRYYALAATLTAWALAPIAFWFFRSGDSARHHFPAAVPVALGVGILLAAPELPLRTAWRYVALAVLVTANYFAFAPSSLTITTSGNLIASGRLVAERVRRYHALARTFAADTTRPRRVLIGMQANAYVEAELLWQADSVLGRRAAAHFGPSAAALSYTLRGRPYEVTIVALGRAEIGHSARAGALRAALAEAYKAAGYSVTTMQFCDRMRRVCRDREFHWSEY